MEMGGAVRCSTIWFAIYLDKEIPEKQE